jgi:hypothetical protein
MSAIYGHRRGFELDSFLSRFDEIRRRRDTQLFAFIFYDFDDSDLRKALDDGGVLKKLDRLSGDELRLFCLRSGAEHAADLFNKTFASKLGIQDYVSFPNAVLFKWADDRFIDISIVVFDRKAVVRGFLELHDILSNSKGGGDVAPRRSKYLRFIAGTAKEVRRDVLEAALREFIHFCSNPES